MIELIEFVLGLIVGLLIRQYQEEGRKEKKEEPKVKGKAQFFEPTTKEEVADKIMKHE